MKAGDVIDIPHEGEHWTIVRSSIHEGGDFIAELRTTLEPQALLARLQAAGVLETRHGIGTFVTAASDSRYGEGGDDCQNSVAYQGASRSSANASSIPRPRASFTTACFFSSCFHALSLSKLILGERWHMLRANNYQ